MAWLVIIALAGVGLLVAYGALAGSLARRWAFQASDRVHRLLPLRTPGHHAALVHHPAVAPTRAAPPVIVCHGMAVNGLCMDALDDGHGSPRLSLARTLAAAGFDVWALELRGRGRATVPRGARWTVDDEVREDVPAAIAAVLESTGASEVWWVGHSKGALVQYLFQAMAHPLAPRVTALVAIGSPGTVRYQRPVLRWLVAPLGLWARVVGDVPLSRALVLLTPLAHLTRWLGRPIDTLVRENDGASLGRLFASIFADVNRGVLEQMLRWVAHPDGALVAMDGRRYDEGFGRLRMPLYFLAGAADRLVPQEAVAYVRDRVSSADVTFEVVGVAGGASHDYGHGDLVLGSRAPDDVFARVVRWLSARVPAGTATTEVPPPPLG